MRGVAANIAVLISGLIGLNTNKTHRPPALGCGQIQILFHRGNPGDDDGRITRQQRHSGVQGTPDCKYHPDHLRRMDSFLVRHFNIESGIVATMILCWSLTNLPSFS